MLLKAVIGRAIDRLGKGVLAVKFPDGTLPALSRRDVRIHGRIFRARGRIAGRGAAGEVRSYLPETIARARHESERGRLGVGLWRSTRREALRRRGGQLRAGRRAEPHHAGDDREGGVGRKGGGGQKRLS